MEKNSMKYLPLIPVVIVLVGIATSFSMTSNSFGAVTLENPQVIVWDKPTTDEEWAEDVKKENFDIKSTSILDEMRVAHTDKLKVVQKNKAEIFECPECIKYFAKKDNPEWTQKQVDEYYAEEVAKAKWEIEKLQQSVERMEKELELRQKGFVVVEGEADNLGGRQKPYAIRTIND